MVVVFELGRPSLGLGLATGTGAGLTLLARWRGWGLPEAHVWQPGHTWPRAARVYRVRLGQEHQQSSDPKE
jgi:hypothetical protein